MLKRCYKFVKDNFWVEIILYVGFLYAISACVFLNGDDFMYATFAKDGIVSNVADYYITGNGRFWINVLDSALLVYDRVLFIIINPLIVMGFIFLLAKNIQCLTGEKGIKNAGRRYIRYGMVMMCCLDVLCAREVVFWITGMMNYLFPSVVFLFAIWIFQLVREKRNMTIMQKSLYFLLCFFASSSVEQYAMMFVGFCTLLLATDLINKRKINGVLIIGYLIAISSLAVLLLAPGNFSRVDEQNGASFMDNLWTIIHQNVASSVAFPFVLMMTLCFCLLICKQKERRIGLFSLCVPASLVLIRIVPVLENAIFISFVILGIVLQLLYCLIYCLKSNKERIISLIIVGIGSQVMLLISDVWGYRCMFSIYTVYMLLIGYFLSQFTKEESESVLCAGAIGSLYPYILILLCVFKIFQKKRIVYYIIRCATFLSAMIAMLLLFIGYKDNVQIHKLNIENTHAAFETEKIDLYELMDDTYSWYSVPMNEFHEEYYRRYYDLPETVKFNYIEKD